MLQDHIHKKPSEMSGGQMQRVAIARALVNNPDILLADEPTGALDSKTSVQIMDLLKEIARDRLVIMVTHNPELATDYSTRIVKLKDGKIIDDSNPCKEKDDTKTTIGVELSSKTFTINNDKINAQFWDTAGEEKYKSMTAAYYKGALGALVIYDITKKQSFESIDRWISDLTNTADKRIQIILIGNKNDLEEQREVSREEGEMKAKGYNIAFMETSALNGKNIEIAFNKLVEEVYNNFRKEFESVANVELMRGKTIFSSICLLFICNTYGYRIR